MQRKPGILFWFFLQQLLQLIFDNPEMLVKSLHSFRQVFFDEGIVDSPMGAAEQFCPHAVHKDFGAEIFDKFPHQLVQHGIV